MEDFRLNFPFLFETVYVYLKVYWKLVSDIEDVNEFTTTPFYLGDINNEQKKSDVFEYVMDSRL